MPILSRQSGSVTHTVAECLSVGLLRLSSPLIRVCTPQYLLAGFSLGVSPMYCMISFAAVALGAVSCFGEDQGWDEYCTASAIVIRQMS
jgi:hypothetical protein